MIALDANVLTRRRLADDAAQYRRAASLLQDGRRYTAPPGLRPDRDHCAFPARTLGHAAVTFRAIVRS